MLLHIDTHSGVPIFRQMQDQIRRQILAGQMEPGCQLPSVRDLAEQLKVNPMTVSKVYSLLEMEGLAERRRGVGLFVSASHNGKYDQKRTTLLADSLRKAAILAVQFDISEDDAIQLFQDIYRELQIDRQRIT
jgi:GntR family transcriptional regulator